MVLTARVEWLLFFLWRELRVMPFLEFSFSARSLGASVASHSRQIVIAIHYAKLNTIGKIEVSYGFVRPARSRTFSEGFFVMSARGTKQTCSMRWRNVAAYQTRFMSNTA